MGKGRMTIAQVSVTNETPNVLTSSAEACPLCGVGPAPNFLCAPDRFHWRKQLYGLNRCSSCSYVWLNCPPKPSEMAVHYDEDYHKTIAAGGEGSAEKRWSRPRSVVQEYSRGGALLDIGCSSGGFLSTLKGGAWKLYGVEMEESTAQRARAASGAEVFVGDVESAPFAPESFDVITCFDLVEHMYHPRSLLQRVMGWLKPGGILIMQVPNIGSWEARLFGSYWYGLELPRHLSHFSPESLHYVMTDLGFVELSIKTPAVSYVERSLGFLASAIVERFGRTPVPQSEMTPQSVLSRVGRKATRVLVFNPFAQIAAVADVGPSIEGVFRKPESRSSEGSSS